MHFIQKNEPEVSCLNIVKDKNLSKMERELNTIIASNSKDKSEKIRKLGSEYWKKVRTGCRNSIKKSILKEQQSLCVYCEKEINDHADMAHLEHIKPKSIYLEKCFDYDNLVMSCNGDECSDVNKEDYEDNIHSCGHPKKSDFDEEKFLNPVELTKITDYFSYDIDTGKIRASEKDSTKAEYMIELLNLENPYLNKSRINARKSLLKKITKSKYPEQEIKTLLNSGSPHAFISYLRYYISTTTNFLVF